MEWRIAALKLFGPFVRWRVRRQIVRVWRAFLAQAGVTEGEVRTMLDGKKTYILSGLAALTALLGLAGRLLGGEIDLAQAVSEAWTVLMPLAVAALRKGVKTSATPAPTP